MNRMNTAIRVTTMTAIVIAAVLAGCSDDGSDNPMTVVLSGTSQMTLKLEVLPELGIDSGMVTITKGDQVYSLPLEFEDNVAVALFTDLQPGTWQIYVELYDEDGFLLYEGSGEAGVVAGQTTTATILVGESTGDLEVIIELPEGSEPAYLVRPDGSGDFPTIQAAVNACVDGDIVELTDGTFTGTGNRNVDFLGKAITVKSQNGNPLNCTIDCEQQGRAFYFHNDEGPASRLEGVTITNGIAADGGGIYCSNASPMITNCNFEGNHSSGGFGHGGGGICCHQAAPVVTECTFRANTSACDGAGMDCDYSSPTISGCEFLQNENGTHNGGGIRCFRSTNVLITDCLYQGNTTGGSGGGIFFHGSTGTITNCELVENIAGNSGGGICCLSEQDETAVEMVGCTIVGNEAATVGGGGISCLSSSSSFSECVVAMNISIDGGGAYCARYYNSPHPCSSVFIGCTFSQNYAANSGGGLACSNEATPALERTIIVFSSEGESISCSDNSSVTLSCVDIYGNHGGDWVGFISDLYGVDGNFSEDPMFCDVLTDDYTIHADSQCAPANSGGCELIGALPVGCGQSGE